MQTVVREIAGQVQSGDFPLSEEGRDFGDDSLRTPKTDKADSVKIENHTLQKTTKNGYKKIHPFEKISLTKLNLNNILYKY